MFIINKYEAFLFLKPYLVEEARGLVPAAKSATSRRIFIVHGRDEDNKNALRDMLTGWGFEPIILAEQPNRGRSLLEKLLVHTSVSSVGYVFVLMTPDDVGATRDKTEDFVTMLFNLSLPNATHATGAELLREYRDTFKRDGLPA